MESEDFLLLSQHSMREYEPSNQQDVIPNTIETTEYEDLQFYIEAFPNFQPEDIKKFYDMYKNKNTSIIFDILLTMDQDIKQSIKMDIFNSDEESKSDSEFEEDKLEESDDDPLEIDQQNQQDLNLQFIIQKYKEYIQGKIIQGHQEDVFQEFLQDFTINNFDMLFKYNQQQDSNKQQDANKNEVIQKKSQVKNVQNINIQNENQFPYLIQPNVLKKINDKQQIKDRMNMHHYDQFKFEVNNAASEHSLNEIQNLFPLLNQAIIQETFDILQRTDWCRELLKIAFPEFINKDNQQYNKVFKQKNNSLVKAEPKKIDFWSNKILKKYKYLYYSKINKDQEANMQSILGDIDIKLQERNKFLKEASLAQQVGKHQLASQKVNLAKQLQYEYDQQVKIAKEFKFSNYNNIDLVNQRIDLHGMYGVEAIETAKQRIIETQQLINQGKVQPNQNDGKNHILKIICGAGHHSKGGIGTNKYKIDRLVKDMGYDKHFYEKEGNVLVRIQKQ